MVKCVRCDRSVDDVQDVPPDAITEELLDSIDHGEDRFAGEGVLRVCAECITDLQRD